MRPATHAEQFDHERDLRKHDPRPTDRLAVQIPTAVDVAALVKQVGITDGANLIEAYADAKAAQGRLDAVAAGAHP